MASIERRLGQSGPAINPISYGLMSLGHTYGNAGDTPARLRVLDDAFKLGMRTWDDADIYGDTEELVGQWLTANPDKRKDIFLATKCGVKLEPPWANSSPDYVRSQCEESLRKLKTDYIDLYYVHRVDDVTPIEKTMEALAELKKAGKIRNIGLSEVSANSLQRAYKVARIDAYQVEYSPFTLDIEKSQQGQRPLIDVCKELNITIFAYSPLGRGFLTGTMQTPPSGTDGDSRSMFPTFSKDNFESNMQLVNAIGEVTKEVQKRQPNTTQSQVVLAWLLAQWEGVVPLFGTKTIARIEENAAAQQVQLSDNEVSAIRSAAEALRKLGERYPQGFNDLNLRDTPEL